MGEHEWKMLFDGAATTLWLSVLSIAIGLVVGLIIALVRNLRIPILEQALAIFISLIRATPLITVALFIFLAAPNIGWEMDKNVAAIMALSINTSAFNAEIWRNALQTFPKEQKEAAVAAGMSGGLMLRRILLPQMFLTSLPGLVNEMTFLIKASPAVAMLGVVDLTRATNRISAVTYEPLPPILVACVIYMVLIGILLRCQRWSERFVYRLSM